MNSSRRISLLLAGCDLIALVLAFGCAVLVDSLSGRDLLPFKQLVSFFVLLPVWFMAAQAAGLYALPSRRVDFSLADEVGPVLLITTAWTWLIVVFISAFFAGITQIRAPVVLWISAIVLVLLLRVLGRYALKRSGALDQRVLIFGEAAEVDLVRRRVERQSKAGFLVVGTLSLGASSDKLTPIEEGRDQEALDFERADSERNWMNLLDRALSVTEASRVIMAPLGLSSEAYLGLVDAAFLRGISLDSVAGSRDALVPIESVYRLEGQPVLSLRLGRENVVARGVKRSLDLLLATSILIVSSPVLLVTAVAVRLSSPGPAIFRQLRTGKLGEEFEILKFRTMTSDSAADPRRSPAGEHSSFRKSSTDPRITPLGNTLRRWSVDELPQFWNVLRGEMSVVGPRPLPPEEARTAQDEFVARLAMRPGITGPWQVYGRSDIPHEDMFRLDYAYVISWSLREDLRLLIHTLAAVFGGRGAR